MHDAGKVIIGLVIFLGVLTSPMWYQAVKGAVVGPPELKINSESPVCVAETAYMRALHMDLLNDWRDEAVRDGNRLYVGLGGVEYDKSIAGTCLGACHSNKEEFCDQCHQYVGAEVSCWDCHAVQNSEAMVGIDGSDFENALGASGVKLASGVAAKPLDDQGH